MKTSAILVTLALALSAAAVPQQGKGGRFGGFKGNGGKGGFRPGQQGGKGNQGSSKGGKGAAVGGAVAVGLSRALELNLELNDAICTLGWCCWSCCRWGRRWSSRLQVVFRRCYCDLCRCCRHEHRCS